MTPRSITLAALGFALALLIVVRAPAQASYDVKAHYAKREVYIPMRDGVKLFTIIYAPRATADRYPILMTRTAYGIAPYGADQYRAVLGPNNEFAKAGYIFVYQDARGKFKSEDEFVHHVPYVKGSSKPNESTDTYDTIDWLVKNVPNNNGRVGQYGISWAGWEVSQGMIDAHPALKASSPQAPPQDQFFGDDYHSGGAYQLMYGFNWMSTNARARVAPSERPAERFRTEIELPFFNFHLKNKGALNLREAIVFETGGNRWHDYDRWPPKGTQARNLYLQPAGRLSFDTPRQPDASDSYVSDPRKP